jgi:hypothetical protein
MKQETPQKPYLRLVVLNDVVLPPPPPAPTSSVTIEIGPTGALQRLEINLRPEDALQAMNGLLMAHMRALALLMH